MTPTACVIDYPIVGVGASSSARSHYGRGRNGIISKRQRLIHRQLPKIADGIRTLVSIPSSTGLIREADTASHAILPDANLPDDLMAQSTLVINRRQDLIDIVIRTLALVRRNYMLQVRLDSLRQEAKNFFQTVLKNQDSERCEKHRDKKMDSSSNEISLEIDDKRNETQIISSSSYSKSEIISLGVSSSDKKCNNFI